MNESRLIIVDAYNMIHRVKDLRTVLEQNLEQSRVALLNRLAAYKQKKNIRVTVVFDGKSVGLESTGRKAGIDILFSRSPQDADTVIKNMVQKSRHRRSVLVVSSDRSVADYARTLGAESMKSEIFFQRFLSTPPSHPLEEKYDRRLSQEEIQEWLDIFNADSDSEEKS